MRTLISTAALVAFGLASEQRGYRSPPSWVKQPRQPQVFRSSTPRRSYQPQPRPEPRPEKREQPRSYQPRPQPKPAKKLSSGILHLKPWEQCQTGIQALQKSLEKKKDRDLNLSPAIGAFGITFMSEMINISTVLEPAVAANGEAIGEIVTSNEEQDTAIMEIMTSVAEAST